MEKKISTAIGFLIIFLVIIPTSWVCYASWVDLAETSNHKIKQVDKIEDDQNNQIITEAEKKKIDVWIRENNLNQYGDPADVVYPGGTPLFNEATGETIDKYDYILKNHPERPWNN